ncbi:unnamed protein product, partial [Sphagnum compactum]
MKCSFCNCYGLVTKCANLPVLLMQLEASKTDGKKSGAKRRTGFGHWPGGPGGPSGGSGRGPYGGSGGGAPHGLDNVQGIDH